MRLRSHLHCGDDRIPIGSRRPGDRDEVIDAEHRRHATGGEHIGSDNSKLTVKFVRTPGLGDVPYPVVMEPNLVVEFYSR